MLVARFTLACAIAVFASAAWTAGCADAALSEGRDDDDDDDGASDSDSDSDTDSDSDADTDSDSDMDSDSDSDTDTDTDTDIDGDTDTDTDVDGDTDADTGSDTGTAADCPFWCVPASTCSLLGWTIDDSYYCDGGNVCCEPVTDTETGFDTGFDTGTDTGTDTDTESDCLGCTASPVGGCASDAVVVGHYEDGDRTVCVEQGDSTSFGLALMSYEVSNWTLSGATWRIDALAVFGYDGVGTISGNDDIPTTIQVGSSGDCNPYDYASSMGDCPAHTGWAGCMFGVDQSDVCHMEIGLASECSYPDYTCLSIDP